LAWGLNSYRSPNFFVDTAMSFTRTFSRAVHGSLNVALRCVASQRVREMTFVSQSALALREPRRSALPWWCFPGQIEFRQQLPHQSAIRSNRELDELETHSSRAGIFG
jgi:hypothetical protein